MSESIDRLQYEDDDFDNEPSTVQIFERSVHHNMSLHDYEAWIDWAERSLKAGSWVRTKVKLRRRELHSIELGQKLLKRIIHDLQEVADIEQNIQEEGSNLTLVLKPRISQSLPRE
ncbi:hypothetical protein ACKFKF_30065 [Phormidesmis sp. 146-12]